MNNSTRDFIFGDGNTMNSLFRQFSMGAIAFAVVQTANAQVSITNIVPMEVPGQGTEIRVMFNGIPPQPAAYQLEQPSRLVLDFEKAQQKLQQKVVPVATKEANSVDVSSDDQRSRLTVNLANSGAFTTRVEGNTFILKINSAETAVKAKNVPVQQQLAKGVSNIGFQRGMDGEGQIVIDLLGKDTPVDVQQSGSKIIVRTIGNKIPTHLARRLNVNDFATPVSTIDSHNDGANGVITIQATGGYEYMAYQAENKLTISLKRPADQNAAKPRSATSYTGQKLSLDFQDIEVRRVLQLLADFTNINIVAADNVGGSISLRLKDVPWDQALDIILKAKNLDMRRTGNVIWVAPVEELIKFEDNQAKAIAQSIKLAPIQTEYIVLHYAKAADILKLIEDSRDGKGAASNGTSGDSSLALESLLSNRGSAVSDSRTNTLIVNDTAVNIDKIRKMIGLLDVAVKQVMVEARVVTADTTFAHELGINWNLQRDNPSFLGGSNGSNVWGGDFSPKFDLGVDLGTATAGNFSFGLLKISDYMLNLELTAMQSDGHGEVLSAPKVLTGDKQKAYILRGDQIPYQTWSAESGVTTTFVDANLKLEVTPSITPDGKVQMALKIEKDTLGELTLAGYAIKTNELETNVLVGDGETVVLGGIFDDAKSNTYRKVPFLGDIPVVGNLFKSNVKTNLQSELLIFVTPRIVNDSVSRNH
ncbi:type IV pilus secretin PilQ [Acinetobacter portensis]|uniref:Type IV pilus secretin PilQ n=1 Tax=Acinetobacter portensis TaxID=1839785 RepID=A0ABY4JVW5_9GAMM|nr:type IV pilus secretin PilQ [Acinetobacter portensis]MCK7607960.1 type IV pilus secretin PilQ [Acinetobacter portensis]MCK7638721.1 type IV pilus secretin PilQ [Acinetobacter portensis]UPO23484.1 type IV pilus secretin PilQ [Acinetobacter portensis]